MSTNALAPWFGSNRTLAHHVGAALAGCEWVGVGFAGGMSELKHFTARTVVVNDLHRAIINLAFVVGERGAELAAYLDSLPFHPDTLTRAQERCQLIESGERLIGPDDTFQWAADYFVCVWMGRSGQAGTDREFKGGLSIRWYAGGGDSVARFRGAAEGLAEWQQVMRRCSFTCLDIFAFLDRLKDKPRHGVYLDPPFPGPGDAYRHKFTTADQRKLAARVAGFRLCRVVLRYYRHPLIEELYPADLWQWFDLAGGKKQTNEAAPEVLIVNKPEAAADATATPAPTRPRYDFL